MYKWACKLVVMILLVTVPLQGLSAVLMQLHCLTDEQHAKAPASDLQHQQTATHEHGASSHSSVQHGGDSSSSNETGHLCCNHAYTGAPSVTVLIAPTAPFVSVTQIFTALPPFFPERLLRPPRS